MIHARESQGLPAPTSAVDPLNASNVKRLLDVFRNFCLALASQESTFGLRESGLLLFGLRGSSEACCRKSFGDNKSGEAAQASQCGGGDEKIEERSRSTSTSLHGARVFARNCFCFAIVGPKQHRVAKSNCFSRK